MSGCNHRRCCCNWEQICYVARKPNSLADGYTGCHEIDSKGEDTYLWGYDTGDYARGIRVGNDGHVYVAGGPDGTPAGNSIYKIDTNGNLVWAKSIAGCSAFCVAVDRHDNVYGGIYRFPSSGYEDEPTLKKFDSDGNVLWSYNTNPAQSRTQVNGIAVNSAGDVYVTTWRTEYPVASGLYRDVWVFDSGGNVIGGYEINSGYNYAMKGIVIDSSDNVYVIDQSRVTKLGAWTYDTGVPMADITVDANDNIYVAGSTTGLWTDTVWKLTPGGAYIWSALVKSYYYETVDGVAVDNTHGHVYVVRGKGYWGNGGGVTRLKISDGSVVDHPLGAWQSPLKVAVAPIAW